MTIQTKQIASLLPLLVTLIASSSATAQEATGDQTNVLEANEKFVAALNAMFTGDPKPFEDVWWHTDDVVYMGTDGAYTVGWKDVYATWEKKAAQNIGGHAKAEDVRVTVAGDMAVASHYVVAVYQVDAQPREVKPRATSVFQKKEGQWRMICHHVDVVPSPGQ